jgi:hypothetical protein
MHFNHGRDRVRRHPLGWRWVGSLCRAPIAVAIGVITSWTLGPPASAVQPNQLGAQATLADIEACVSQNLPNDAGVIEFSVEAIDRSEAVVRSRAEIRWTKDDNELARVLLRVSEPAKTAGTALLIMDKESDQPEFFLRLPEIDRDGWGLLQRVQKEDGCRAKEAPRQGQVERRVPDKLLANGHLRLRLGWPFFVLIDRRAR